MISTFFYCFFCKSTLFFCLIGPISECRAQKTLILSCLFDNEAVFTESKLPVAIIFACLSEFTSELEKDRLHCQSCLLSKYTVNYLDLTQVDFQVGVIKNNSYNISLTFFFMGNKQSTVCIFKASDYKE